MKITNEAHALSDLLTYAQCIGLPEPTNFRYDHQCEQLVLQMATARDVIQWARWMEVEHESEFSGRETYWRAEGLALDARVRVTAFSIDATNAEVEAVGLPAGAA